MKNANISNYERFIRRLVKRFDVKQTKTSLTKLAKHEHAKTLHELERSVMPTPLQISVEGDKNLCDTFPKERSPLHEEISSQKEVMDIPLSKEDQDLRSLIDNEVFSNIDEKE